MLCGSVGADRRVDRHGQCTALYFINLFLPDQPAAVLVVAHRLTQAAAADTVLVLDAGRVVEHGTTTSS